MPYKTCRVYQLGGHLHTLAPTTEDFSARCFTCSLQPRSHHDACRADTALYTTKEHRDAGVPKGMLAADLHDGAVPGQVPEAVWRPVYDDVGEVLRQRWGSIILTGAYGTGKSVLAAAIVRNLADPQHTCAWLTCPTVANSLHKLYAEHGIEEEWARPYVNARLLVLDGFAEQGTTPNVMRVLEGIIMARYDAGRRPVLITTNQAPATLQTSCSPAVWDRLAGGARVHQFSGESFRWQNHVAQEEVV